MTARDYGLVIFDCDGTLVDSEWANNSAFAEILAAEGLTQYTAEYAMEHFVGSSLPDLLKQLSAETGHTFPPDFRQYYVRAVNRRIATDVTAIDDAAATIEAIIARGIPVCVASNGERSNVIGCLQTTGLIRFFPDTAIFTKDQVGDIGKPAPDLFLYAAAQMDGIAADRCLVIEDSVTGARAGVAAKMDVLGFTGSSHDKAAKAAALSGVPVTAVIGGLRDILSYTQG